MTTALLSRDELKAFAQEVRRRANAQVNAPATQRLLALRLTVERVRLSTLQRAHWTKNRRDCWAFAQSLAPMDVKRMIWEHEEDELIGNKVRGVEDHAALRVRQGALFGLTPEDFRNAPVHGGTRTCMYAWVHLVRDSPWPKAVAACAALEIGNSAEWVDGGGMSYRNGKRLEEDLGIPFDKQVNAKEHAEVDVEHAHMLMQIAQRHGTPETLRLMMDGLIESWEIDLVWRSQLTEMMETLPGPA